MNTSFRTALIPSRSLLQMQHGQQLLLSGSCFTEHIGQKLHARKFQTCVNPFGIVYNPVSILEGLDSLVDESQWFTPDSLFENNGLWHSWEHHGRFSHPDKLQALEGINRAYKEAAGVLKTAQYLLLTFGTADVFFLCDTGRVVANNHKMPAAHFGTRRLSVQEITEKALSVLKRIRQLNPHIQVILTVSPVRHLRSGMIENQRSKAALLLACADICGQLDFAHYFPAYELLLDDLRDYRFYAADMVHPSETAVDYVWAYFSETYFPEKTQMLNQRIEKLQAAVAHRPFHPDTAEYRAFAQAQFGLIQQLKKEMPQLDFEQEEAHFKKAIGA